MVDLNHSNCPDVDPNSGDLALVRGLARLASVHLIGQLDALAALSMQPDVPYWLAWSIARRRAAIENELQQRGLQR